MAFRTQKISQMTPKGANLEGSDLIEVSTIESGSYVTRSITGQEIIDAVSGSGVTSVTGTAPIASTGGTTPAISIATANTSTTGALSSTDWNTFNNKQDSLVSGTNIKTIEGQSLLGSGNIDLTKSDVGLGNVDNTSDLNKPISTATQTALNAKQDTLTLTTTGTSGAATLVGATLNIPQYSGGGGSSNPSVIAASYADGTAVTGTTANTISQSLLIPANSFSGNGMLEVLCRTTKTGALGSLTTRIYVNTTNSLTGASLIGIIVAGSFLWGQGIRTMRINTNTLTCIASSSSFQNDNTTSSFAPTSATFTTSVDNYIIIAIQLGNAGDSAKVEMSRAVKYI